MPFANFALVVGALGPEFRERRVIRCPTVGARFPLPHDSHSFRFRSLILRFAHSIALAFPEERVFKPKVDA